MDQVPALDNTFGATLIGVILASVLYGVSCSQVFYYFQHYSKKDGFATKAVVVATLISDTVHQALICHTIYIYVIKGFSRPQLLGEIVWSLIVEVLFNGITAFLVQTFFATRIWRFSHRNVLVVVTLAIFIVAEFVSVIVYVAKAAHMTTFVQLATLRPLSMTVNALAVAGDVLITVAFCILLNRARNSIQRSNTMINLLIAFSVQTGMLTSFCAIASLISISVSPDTFIYISFYFLLGRLYCNSLLATLNVRNAIREKGHGDLGISLRAISGSNTSTVDNHKELDVKAKALGHIPDAEAEGYLTGAESPGFLEGVSAHDLDSRPPFVQSVPDTTDSGVVENGPELESGGSERLRWASS